MLARLRNIKRISVLLVFAKFVKLTVAADTTVAVVRKFTIATASIRFSTGSKFCMAFEPSEMCNIHYGDRRRYSDGNSI